MTDAERITQAQARMAALRPPETAQHAHHYHVFPDADGWCTGARMSEGPGSMLGASGVRVAAHECLAVLDIPGLFHHRDGTVSCPQDDRRAWQELRARYPARKIPGLLTQFRDHRKVLAAVDLPETLPTRRPRPPAAEPFPGLPWSPPGMADLIVRELTHTDITDVTTQAIELGTEPAVCPDPASPCCQPPEAHAWMSLANRVLPDSVWAFTVTWRGQPIQFELMEQVPGQSPISIGTHHLSRERPGWFWREAWRPIVEGLQALGYTTARGAVRGDLTEWVETLKTLYAARPSGRYRGGGHYLTYDLAAIPFQGFPTRRTVPGQASLVTGAPGVEVREIDLATATAEITKLWTARGTPNASRNMAESLRIVSERWALDSATILGGFVHGECRSVVCLSPRSDTDVAPATCTPFIHTGESGLMQWGFMKWCQRAGYVRQVAWYPKHQMDMIESGRLKTRVPWTVERRRATAVEVSADIATVLRRPAGEWTADLTVVP